MDSKTLYQKVASHEAKKGEFKKCLLLYSGGLDTSTMLKWIQDEYNVEVVACTVDLGQTADNLSAIREKALKLGAIEALTIDARGDMANLCAEAIRANAEYQGGYALGCPLGRLAISQVAVQMAEKYNCSVVAHGATGKGNDQVRFESYITTLNPNLKTIAPVREWSMGRDEQIEYAHKHGIPIVQTKESPYSYDENMWANTGEGGEIEDPKKIPPLEKILKWCVLPENAPDTATLVKIEFEKGVPVAIDGQKMPLQNLIFEMNKIGGAHGVGYFHLIEDRLVGLKVRGIYENPAAHILIEAHQNLEQLVSTREENELKRFLDTKWAYLTYAAKYFEPVMENIRAFQNKQNEKVSGVVTAKLFKGKCEIVALESKNSLFNENLATFNKNANFNQNASAGFIEIYNLPQKTAFQIRKKAF